MIKAKFSSRTYDPLRVPTSGSCFPAYVSTVAGYRPRPVTAAAAAAAVQVQGRRQPRTGGQRRRRPSAAANGDDEGTAAVTPFKQEQPLLGKVRRA